jgi:hypothetical protein
VAVEKLPFHPKLPKFGDRKCPGDPRESFIAHPDAILFLRFSLSGVFQQPQALALIDRVVSEMGMLQQQELPQG